MSQLNCPDYNQNYHVWTPIFQNACRAMDQHFLVSNMTIYEASVCFEQVGRKHLDLSFNHSRTDHHSQLIVLWPPFTFCTQIPGKLAHLPHPCHPTHRKCLRHLTRHKLLKTHTTSQPRYIPPNMHFAFFIFPRMPEHRLKTLLFNTVSFGDGGTLDLELAALDLIVCAPRCTHHHRN